MKKHEGSKKKFGFHFILALAAFLCCLFVIAGLNKPHFFPFSTRAELSSPTSLAVSDNGSVMIDSEGRRMLIISADDNVSAIVESTASGSPVDKFETATISDGYIYVIGTSHYAQGVYISAEAVLKYDMKGNYLETLTSRSYEAEEYVNTASFRDIIGYQGSICLTCADEKEAQVLCSNDFGEAMETFSIPEYIYTAAYAPAGNLIATIGIFRNYYAVDCNTETQKSMSLSDLIGAYIDGCGIDPSGFDLNELANYCCFPKITFNADGAATHMACTNPFNGETLVLTADGETVDCCRNCTYSPMLFLQNLFFYIALTLLTAIVVYLLVRLFVKNFTAKARIVAVIIGAIIFTAVFYTMQINTATKAEFNRNLVAMTKQDAYLISESSGENLEKMQEDGISDYCSDPKNQDSLIILHDRLKTMCDFHGSTSSFNITIALMDKEGTPYYLANSRNLFPYGKKIGPNEAIQAMMTDTGRGEILTLVNSYETQLYCYDNIYSTDGRVIGYLAISSYRGNIDYIQSQYAFNLAIILVAIFIGIYVLFSACQSFGIDFKRRKNRDKSDITGRTIDMAGILIFAIGFVSSLDSVIMVYVSESLCVNVDPANQAFMVALPMAAVGAGQLVGTLIAETFIRRLGERTSAVISSVLTAVSMLTCVFAIVNGNIIIYIIGIFGINIFMCGIMHILINTLPYKTKDKEEQQSVLHSLIKCNMAASIISMLSAGFISEYLSYSMIYLLGAILTVSVLILSVIALRNEQKHKDKNAPELSRKQRLADSAKYWTIFIQKPMLIFILFYVIPGLLVGGYKSYLFPLYSSESGISALLLSNISIFVKALTYVTMDPLRNFTSKFKSGAVQLIPRFIQCFGLICFLISPNIYWAIIMLFVIDIMNNMTRVGSKMYLTNVTEKAQLDIKRVQSNYYTVSSVLYIFQSPVLSCIVSLGMNTACSAVGLIAGGMYLVFGLMTRKNSGDNEDKADSGP